MFAATRYRRWSLPVLMAAGVGVAVASFAYTWVRFDYASLAPGLLVVMFVLRCTGRAAGWLAGTSDRQGAVPHRVLSGLAIERDLRTTNA